jgi:acyl transferase domain-containing protein/NADPH:quinone reductase-like Zn-dependent oxidoreductase
VGTELTEGVGGSVLAGREPTLSAARLAVAARRARTEAGRSAQMMLSEPIAIVGMGCRFPGGANNPAEYWRLLAEGRSGIRMMPEERWADARKTLAPHLLLGGYLDDVDRFDAEFFGIAPREAHSIDPQQRLLLEVCWEALADGGIAPSALSGSETGVFIAVYSNDYARLQMQDGASIDSHTGVGAAHSVAAGRLSFLLNLHGPCMAVDTACSSSLVAAHLACQSLRQRECNVAIVGGSSLKLLPDEVRVFAQWGMLSSDGQAKTFDAAADGFVPGEGCGVIVLKRLSDAVAQGDQIHAVIRGAAVNHDGRSSVLTAPNGPAQEAVIRAALRDGQVAPGDISFVEAHGTGTSLGDPIEVEALEAVYGPSLGTGGNSPCLLGAVKTNFGHLEAAAGVAALIKVVLALENQAIPRNLSFVQLNPQISLATDSRLRLALEAQPWPRSDTRAGQPRFAGVSSFGLGGTNAHLILEEAPVLPRIGNAGHGGRSPVEYCLPVSAHTSEALIQTIGDYAALLRSSAGDDLGDIARAAARGRDHGLFRVAVSGTSVEEIALKLEVKAAEMAAVTAQVDDEPGWRLEGGVAKLAFVFSGQGSLWPGMLPALVEHFPEAEKTFAICEQLVMEAAGWSLRAAAESAADLEDTAKAQPILFAMQMALVRLLESWGVAPEGVAGHSVGEVAAAVSAGALSLEEGMRLVLKRGARMGKRGENQERGRMLSAEMSEAEAASILAQLELPAGCSAPEIAAVNGPRSLVFSGPESAMNTLASALATHGIGMRWLDVQYAFHSAAMDSACAALELDLETGFGLGKSRPSISLVSTVTGGLWQAADGDAAYWARGIRQPVQFRQAADRLIALGCRTVVEIGPHPVLRRSVISCAAGAIHAHEKLTTIAAMRRGQSARSTLMSAAAALYEHGCDLNWEKVYPGAPAHVALPLYRWNRQRYWLTEPSGKSAHSLDAALAKDFPAELPGREISSPFLQGRLWETRLSTETFPWLGDHRFQGQPIFPFAAWLESARRAAAVSHGSEAWQLREFAVQQRLEVGADGVALQTLVAADGAIHLAAKSLAAKSGEGWQNFASGFWQAGQSTFSSRMDIVALKTRATEIVAAEDVYRELGETGLTYGPAFCLLQKVYRGPGFALGEVAGLDATTDYGPALHPALLDACLQTLQAARAPEQRGVVVLPASVQSYRVLRAANEVFALAEMRTLSGTDVEEADITIVDRKGALVAEIRGLRVRRVVAAHSRKAPMWKLLWRETPEQENHTEQSHIQASWYVPGLTGEDTGSKRMLSGFARALRSQGDLIHEPAFDAGSQTGPLSVLLAGGLEEATRQLLNVVRLEQAHPGAIERVCLVTRGAVEVQSGEKVDPEQAALLGLTRSFRAEFPAIVVQMVDLPGSSASITELSCSDGESDDDGVVVAEASQIAEWRRQSTQVSNQGSMEIALRNGKFFSPQLEHFRSPDVAQDKALVIGSPGLLETLHEEVSPTPDPATDEVQIECRAHGLNFRDVLTAMGSYAGASAPLGAECAGIVIKAGDAAGIAPGAAVVAFAGGSMRSRVNVSVSHVVRKPAEMSFAEAATIPVAFLTAHYAFTRLARLESGQTVLIHSAAGGLGQAAVQLARRCGATVIATAGTPEKRAYLRSQGIAHIFDSRSEKFAEEVLAVTGGAGVNVVLNALSGDKIAAGFKALRQGGAFLEVGKRDIWSASKVAAIRPDARCWAFDLGEVSGRDPELIAQMLHEIFGAFAKGELSPLPSEIYAIDQAESAFRHMASGRHVGKLVLVRPPPPMASSAWTTALREGTVLITGGTGALGLSTARWLLEQGAKSLILLSRRGVSDEARRMQDEFAEQGACLVVEAADVANRDQLGRVLERACSRDDAPLRVVIHAAGEVDDRLLAEHSGKTFASAMRTKVEGARLLDELDDMTAANKPITTIYFSSAAALLGSAGQASYAAANAYLDGLAEERTARGLHTLSVNWGAWADGGMAAQLSDAATARMARQGVRPMQPAAALAALGGAILSGHPRVTIADVDWDVYREQRPAGSSSGKFFATFLPDATRKSSVVTGSLSIGKIGSSPSRTDAGEIASIREAARSERLPRMEAFVRAASRKVLGLSAGRPMPVETPMQEFGLDSLMALELRNVLAQALGRPLSATLLFDYPSIRGLSQFLLSMVVPQEPDSATVTSVTSSDGLAHMGAFPLDEELAAMSDDEAEELLLAELDRKGRI